MRVSVRAKTNSRRPRVRNLPDDDGKLVLEVAVAEPPVDGKANDAIRQALARHFDVPASQVLLVRGASSRTKLFEVTQ